MLSRRRIPFSLVRGLVATKVKEEPCLVPMVKFNNGQQNPIFGLGTWNAKPEEVSQAVQTAIDIGYRHIDCAHIYGNEKEVGDGIKAKYCDGTVMRSDLYITSKLWNTMHRPDLVEPAMRVTLENLGLTYVNIYLMHWPFALKEGDDLFPKDDCGKPLFSDVDYVDTWKAMENLQNKGYTRSIGVANFNKAQLERLMCNASIMPVTNQVEVHPYFNQQKLIEYCRSKNIIVTAYSPLGSPSLGKPDDPKLLEDCKLQQIAKNFNKTPAQIALRYQIQRGCITIPKSVTKERIQENFDIWDFEFSSACMAVIDELDKNKKMVTYADAATHKFYPFNDEC